jgi:hypothetical protein
LLTNALVWVPSKVLGHWQWKSPVVSLSPGPDMSSPAAALEGFSVPRCFMSHKLADVQPHSGRTNGACRHGSFCWRRWWSVCLTQL